MPHRRTVGIEPDEWLRRARSDLLIARRRSRGVYLVDLCFHAQQASEKALKALLIQRQVSFPFVHDLALLLTLVQNSGLTPPSGVLEAATLTRFAVTARYPGVAWSVSRAEHAEAVSIAESVIVWVESQVGDREK
jgi:HEPN domain-containing protein